MSDKEQARLAQNIESGNLKVVAQTADGLPPTSSVPPVQAGGTSTNKDK